MQTFDQTSAGAKPLPVLGPISATAYAVIITMIVTLNWAVKKYRLLPTVLVVSIGTQIAALFWVPLVVLIIRWRTPKREERPFQREPINFSWLPDPVTSGAFALLFFVVFVLMRVLTELDILKLAATFQFLGFGLLGLKVAMTGKVSGISAKKLALDAVWLSCRIGSAYLLGKRLPRKSNNGFVNGADAMSLLVVLGLLLCAFRRQRATSLVQADTFNAWLLLAIAAGLALVVRLQMSLRYVDDVLWSFSLYLDAVAMLPQLLMVAQSGGVVDEAMSHHIAAMFVSRLLGSAFWWLIRGTWLQGVRFTGWVIFAVYMGQLLFLCQYMCYYLKACGGAASSAMCRSSARPDSLLSTRVTCRIGQ